MSLGNRDILPTIVAAISVYVGVLIARGVTLPVIHSQRWALIILLGLGMVTCASSGLQHPDWKNAYIIIASIIGGLALVVAIIGLIKPSAMIVGVLAWIIVALWAMATARHAMV